MGCLASGAYPPARYLHGDEEAAFLGWAGDLRAQGVLRGFPVPLPPLPLGLP